MWFDRAYSKADPGYLHAPVMLSVDPDADDRYALWLSILVPEP